VAEVNAILGTQVTGGEPTYPAPLPRGLSSCLLFNHGAQPYQPVRGLRIDLWREDDSHQVFAVLMPSGGEPIAGLGDEAKGVGGSGSIVVRKGRVVIGIFAATPQLPFVTLAQLRNLAATALSRA